VTTTTTQQTNAFSVGLPKSPFSLGAENTTTTTSQGFGGPITERTQSQMIGGVSRMPSTSGKSSGTTFSIGVYYKAEVKINFMQAITNLFR
jgi:hypothetical protein